jgi:hypothetical protein
MAADLILMRTSVKNRPGYARIIVVSPFILLLALVTAPASQRITVEPFLPVSVRYPASIDAGRVRQDLAAIQAAGFNAISTSISWRDGEPRRGAYDLSGVERLVAAAAETGLRVRVEVHTQPEPAWKRDGTNALAGEFYEYVRRRLVPNPAVFAVSPMFAPDQWRSDRATVGNGPGALTLRQARKALWAQIASGARSFEFIDADGPVSPALLAIGETAGVITRNQALFAPLEPRPRTPGEVTISGGGQVSVHILESSEAMAIIGINQAAEARKVAITFPPAIPEAIWQNMEAGVSVHFVMSARGPVLEHTFAPEDVIVLAIRKTLR